MSDRKPSLLDLLGQYMRDAAPGGVLNPEGQPVANYGKMVRGNLASLLDDPAAFTQSALLDVLPSGAELDSVRARAEGRDYDKFAYQKAMDKAIDLGSLVGSIRVYHGSPHKFDKFDLSKIGTGEGAQAYGHGLYMAESPNVAEEYAGRLAESHSPLSVEPRGDLQKEIQDWARKVVEQYGGPLQNRNEWVSVLPDSAEFNAARQFGDDNAAFKALNRLIKRAEKGNLYEADLRWPDAAREAADPMGPQHFLDWDKPLSEQSDDVLKKLGYHKQPRNFDLEAKAVPGTQEYAELERLMDSRVGSPGVPDVRGSEFYRENGLVGLLHDKGADVAMSEYLRSLGIPGIRYLDAGSRGAGQGTSNYVVFDDALIEILKRNGVPVK